MYRVVDNKTKEVKAVNETTFTDWYAVDRQKMRKRYTDCTVELYYGKIDGNPASTIKTFH